MTTGNLCSFTGKTYRCAAGSFREQQALCPFAEMAESGCRHQQKRADRPVRECQSDAARRTARRWGQ